MPNKVKKTIKETNQAWEKQLIASVIVRGFVACLHVLIFLVIGHLTINIPKIFQVFLLV